MRVLLVGVACMLVACGNEKAADQADNNQSATAAVAISGNVSATTPSEPSVTSPPAILTTNEQVDARQSEQFKACMNRGDAARGITSGMMNCLGDEIDRQDKQLNDTYRNLMDRLPTAKQSALREQQRAWIPQRDAHCKAASDGAGGGTLSAVFYSDCILLETIQRIAWLESYQR